MSLIDLLTGAGGLGLIKTAYDDLSDLGKDADKLGTELAEQQLEQTQFQPYTIKTATGGQFMAGPDGSYTMQLTPREQAIQNALFGQSSNLLGQPVAGADQLQQAGLTSLGRGQEMLGQDVFGVDPTRAASTQAFGLGSQFMEQAGLPLGERTAAVYEQLRGLQRPEQERERANLESRLAAQGRLGVRSNLFAKPNIDPETGEMLGYSSEEGTPEEFYLSQAQEEARNQAAFQAINQARSEQAQQAQLGAQYAGLGSGFAGQAQGLSAAQQAQALQAMQAGQGFLGGSQGLQIGQQQLGLGALAGAYMPQQQLLPALSAGQTAAAQQQQAQMYGAGLYGEARASGLDMLLSSYLGRSNLAGSLGSGLLSGALPGILEGGFDIFGRQSSPQQANSALNGMQNQLAVLNEAPQAAQVRPVAPGNSATQVGNSVAPGNPMEQGNYQVRPIALSNPTTGGMAPIMDDVAFSSVMPSTGGGMMAPQIIM